MNCEHIEPLLTGYVLGDLDAKMQQDVAAHLHSCTACRTQMETIRGTVDDVRLVLTSQSGSCTKLDPKRRKKILGARRRRAYEIPAILKVAAVLVVLLGWFGVMFIPALCSVRGKAQYCLASSDSPACEMSSMLPGALEKGPSDSDSDGLSSDGALFGNRAVSAAAPASTPPSLLTLPAPKVAESEDHAYHYSSRGLGVAAATARRPPFEKSENTSVVKGSAPSEPVFRESIQRTGGGRKDSVVSDFLEGSDKADTPQEVQFEQVGGSVAGYSDDGKASSGKSKSRAVSNFELAVSESPLMMKGLSARRSETSKECGRGGEEQRQDSSAFNGAYGDRNAASDEVKSESSAPGDVVVTVAGVVSGSGAISKTEEIDRKKIDAWAFRQAQNKPVAAAKAEALVLTGSSTYSGGTVVSAGTLAIGRTSGALSDLAGSATEPSKTLSYPAPVFNELIDCAQNPFSTFGIDVDTASFTLARRSLMGGQLPPPGAVRVEEFVNAFDYHYPSPERRMFAVYTDRTRSPFRPNLELLRIGVRGKVIGRDQQRPSALTFVIDTSGSMNTPDRLPLVQKSLTLLLEHLTARDTVTLIAFGSEARLLLDSTPAAQRGAIMKVLRNLQTYGSTHLEGGMRLGYETAARHFQSGAINRVVLLSDGVANLGASTAGEILSQVEAYRKQGIYCSVFGFGQGNYDDTMLQTLADKGDGVYRFVDSVTEAKRVFVDDLSAMLHVIARDVKIQVEFDPSRVKAYRQLGYEKRHLEKEQFRDNTVDAGEVGSGQSATALYELDVTGPAAEPLGTVRVRWNDVETGQFEEMAQPIRAADAYATFDAAPIRFRLAAGLAEFAEKLRESPYASDTTMDSVSRILRPIGLELNLDQQVQDVVRMAETASKLKRK